MSIPYLRIERSSRVPLSQQVAEQLVQAIRARRIQPGQSLPTVRQLASFVQISLETAQKAYHLLQRDGWIISRPRHGTIVSPNLPSSIPMLPPKREQQRFELLQQLKTYAHLPGMFPVSGISLPPDETIRTGLKEVAGKAVELALHMEEHDPFGLLPLRSKIQGLLIEKGFWSELSSICMVNGTQQAISLLADQLLTTEDVVGITEMCYLPVKEVFQQKGARVIPIRQDRNGIDLTHLEEVCKNEKLTYLYTMPNAHYPTGESWSAEKKKLSSRWPLR
ncbi:GntR family transcriptional regulator [Paenactinomyces guangxiensis]|uniref:PLP-dependent aminotransferase family protein n=1 Tax=Paenactinomyces guangxiensis TaxID=1490290 RepID=A0A7W2A978_9BACL|nr:PLP-dependent aminotransferase family protein [Paenactinomyces guangxiensis]MBA4494897.1 PLP-dependent aminotransferase family protein [Paenactinomyces guangxiensis]MBH8591980.1 PLP-dependent aminotransferase family protein [Paenactinomyces guangxiensis]